MNKSILKHEARSMKWILLLYILASLFIVFMFSLSLDEAYGRMFSNGIFGDQNVVLRSLRDIIVMTLIIFTVISIIQIYMQFRPEKNQETGRFLKSLPIEREEFFKIKLGMGLLNLIIAFLILTIGIAIVRYSNMFWVKDIYKVSVEAEYFIKADGMANILKEMGVVYLSILSFYTFLFMVQYTFSNVVGGIVTGTLVWLSPSFITIASTYLIEKFGSLSQTHDIFINYIHRFAEWLLPWIYALTYEYNPIYNEHRDVYLGGDGSIGKPVLKYIILIFLILINIILAYRFNKESKIENENMIIPFRSTRTIFKIGVTICSGLLLFTILNSVMMIQMNNILDLIFLLIGGGIGYFISNKITQVGIR